MAITDLVRLSSAVVPSFFINVIVLCRPDVSRAKQVKSIGWCGVSTIDLCNDPASSYAQVISLGVAVHKGNPYFAAGIQSEHKTMADHLSLHKILVVFSFGKYTCSNGHTHYISEHPSGHLEWHMRMDQLKQANDHSTGILLSSDHKFPDLLLLSQDHPESSFLQDVMVIIAEQEKKKYFI